MTLLQRDHDDLQRGLDEIARPASPGQLRNALDGVRLGLTAHAEAEDIVLHGVLATLMKTPGLERAVGLGRAAHLAQEGALAALVLSRPGTTAWRDRAVHLRDLIHTHARQELAELMPVLREAEVYPSLAGAFATERLRQLAMLQPSAPIEIYQLAAMS